MDRLVLGGNGTLGISSLIPGGGEEGFERSLGVESRLEVDDLTLSLDFIFPSCKARFSCSIFS